jgi:hypothetical protein
MRVAISKGPNRVGVSLPSPEDGNRSSFRNVVFSSYLEFRTMSKVQEPSKSCLLANNANEIHYADFLDKTPQPFFKGISLNVQNGRTAPLLTF